MVERPKSRSWSARLAVASLVSTVAVVGLANLWSESLSQTAESTATVPGIAWNTIESVLTSPRCMNCHPRSDRPTQGEDMRPHGVNVQRGPDGRGMPAMLCSACHQAGNQEIAGIPGAPAWHLAPLSMGWSDLTSGALCRSIRDPRNNGDMTIADLVAHMTSDLLVLWAWEPGGDRTPPPVSLDQFANELHVWMEAGAPCPD